jgi:hypothetical protein
MSQPESTPGKDCKHCGVRMERKLYPCGTLESIAALKVRKYCSRDCVKNSLILSLKPKNSRKRARRLLPAGPCSKCGTTIGVHVHHKDHDFTNNALENLQRLCFDCHAREHRQQGPCLYCGECPTAHGLCRMHYARLRKYGDPLKVTREIKRKVIIRMPCRLCSDLAATRGLCRKHYNQERLKVTRPCIRNCGKPSVARGLCLRHYCMAKRHGVLSWRQWLLA